jgi:raffinose/stachyose/melibiose transport system substrate-binding protein
MAKRGIILAAALLALAMAASAQTAKLDPNTKVTVTVYHQWDPSSPEGPIWDETVAAFTKIYPNVKIDVEFAAGEPYHQKLQAMAVSGQLPDVMFLYAGKRTGYVTGRALVKDLRPLLGQEIKDFLPAAMMPQGPNGEIYELPQNIDVAHVMYVNRSLQAKLNLKDPTSLEDLLAQGKKIRAAGYTPISMGNKDPWVMGTFMLSELVDRYGGTAWFDKAMTGKGASFKDPSFVKALEDIKTLADNKLFSTGVNQLTYSQGFEEFMQGKAVYHVNGGWRVPTIIQMKSAAEQADIAMIAWPEVKGQVAPKGSTIATPGNGFGMNAKLEGAKAQAAWAFIEFFSGEGGSRIGMSHGLLPAYKLDFSQYELAPITKTYLKFIDGRAMGYIIDAKMDGEGMSVLNPGMQEMTMGKKSPKQVAEEYEAWVAANDSSRTH